MIDLAKVRNFYIACGYTDLRLGEELEKLMPWHPAVRHREHMRK